VCEDFSVNGVLAAGKRFALLSWAGRSGISEMPRSDATPARCMRRPTPLASLPDAPSAMRPTRWRLPSL
jgi:hypothetical protein